MISQILLFIIRECNLLLHFSRAAIEPGHDENEKQLFNVWQTPSLGRKGAIL